MDTTYKYRQYVTATRANLNYDFFPHMAIAKLMLMKQDSVAVLVDANIGLGN